MLHWDENGLSGSGGLHPDEGLAAGGPPCGRTFLQRRVRVGLMLHVTLPSGARRAEVRSFCVVCAALLLVALACTPGLSRFSGFAAGIVVVLAIVGVWFHRVILLP